MFRKILPAMVLMTIPALLLAEEEPLRGLGARGRDRVAQGSERLRESPFGVLRSPRRSAHRFELFPYFTP